MHIPAADVTILKKTFDDEGYVADDAIKTDYTAAGALHLATGATAQLDPLNNNNITARYTGSNSTIGDFLQIRSWVPDISNTYYITGDFYREDNTQAQHFINIRTSTSKALLSFEINNGRITVNSVNSGLTVDPNKWVHYTIMLKPNNANPANSTMKAYVSGGLTGRDYFESAESTIDLSGVIADLSKSRPYIT